jgi:hypothetical protein
MPNAWALPPTTLLFVFDRNVEALAKANVALASVNVRMSERLANEITAGITS